MRARAVADRLDRVVGGVGDLASRVPWAYHGLRVDWHPAWDDEVDAAAVELAGRLGADVELHRTAGRERHGVDKRHAIVRRGDLLVGVVSLRRRGDFWELVTETCLPCAEVLAAPDDRGAVLHATRLNIRVDEVPPESLGSFAPDRTSERIAHRAELGAHEEVWRSSRRFMRNLRNVRNRTAHLEVRTGERDDIERIVRLWGRIWEGNPLRMQVAEEDMIAVYEYLHDRGRLQIAALIDDGRLVGGAINTTVDGVVYGMCIARDHDHPVQGLGTRVLEEGFAIAAATGEREFDLLTGLEYKRRWAPIEVHRYEVEYVPVWLAAYRGMRSAAGRAVRALRSARSGRSGATPDAGDETSETAPEPAAG